LKKIENKGRGWSILDIAGKEHHYLIKIIFSGID